MIVNANEVVNGIDVDAIASLAIEFDLHDLDLYSE
jgi:hypothetical protein